MTPKMTRIWAMPTPSTFDCPPIGGFVQKYLRLSKVSIDPFSGGKRWATLTNDLNPSVSADYHLSALEFLTELTKIHKRVDLIIFDPPYTIYQMKQCYASVGLPFMQEDAQQAGVWTREKDLCCKILNVGGIFLHFGYHSNGMGKMRGMELIEVLLVAHGKNHYDTICTAERKIAHQPKLLESES